MRITATKQISTEDRDFILNSLSTLLIKELTNEKILLTGATGFFGKWLTQTLIAANDIFALKNQLTILTRNRTSAIETSPWIADRADINILETDVRNWNSESSKEVYSTIIHGAATASRSLDANSPNEMFDTIVEGTKNVLDCAKRSNRLLFISSGAVYGPQGNIEQIKESDSFQSGPYSAYTEAKRVAEQLCLSSKSNCKMTIARCFAFLGPYLPLDTHFAAGNFLLKALEQKTILIGGDGTPLRSYLYPTDLTIWLLTILLNGQSNSIYNVGSDQSLSIFEIARKFSTNDRSGSPLEIEIARVPDTRRLTERYIPSIEKAKRELNLRVWTSLDEAIAKTLAWYRV